MPKTKNKYKKKSKLQISVTSEISEQLDTILKLTSNEDESKNSSKNLKNLQNLNKKFEITTCPKYGRYLVAKKDLKPGELLINELPLVIGPCVCAEPVCLGCYQPVTLQNTQYRCPDCQWPMCSSHCYGFHQINGHTINECNLWRTSSLTNYLYIPSSTEYIKNLYELILIIRILLMKQNTPERYEHIMLMECHYELRKQNSELWQHYDEKVVKNLHKNFKQFQKITDEVIHRICGILDVNCFEIGQSPIKARALYPNAFLLAHDCCPNTTHTDDPKTYKLQLRTSRQIRKNETITLSYAYTLQGTLKRRDFIQSGKLFWCCCSRCSDPYELGSDCSALICSACKKGYLRSLKPLDQSSKWQCDMCDYSLNSTQIVKLLERINLDLESIDVHNVRGLENFLERYVSVLGPNHYFFLSAKYSLCQIYGRINSYLLSDLSLDQLKRKETYCRDFLHIINMLEPGLTRLRGLIMYELHAPLMMIIQNSMMAGVLSRREFKQKINEITRLLDESSKILQMEPEGSSEYEMGRAAAEALINIKNNEK